TNRQILHEKDDYPRLISALRTHCSARAAIASFSTSLRSWRFVGKAVQREKRTSWQLARKPGRRSRSGRDWSVSKRSGPFERPRFTNPAAEDRRPRSNSVITGTALRGAIPWTWLVDYPCRPIGAGGIE